MTQERNALSRFNLIFSIFVFQILLSVSQIRKALNQEPAQELQSRAAQSVEAHHHVNGPDTGRNSGEMWTIKNIEKTAVFTYFIYFYSIS